MALSNWDTWALTHEGKPCEGSFTSPAGVEVELYKNWLYVRDPQAWRPGEFCEPVVMEVTQGNIVYRDVHILAWRGPQGGVYAQVWTGWGTDDKPYQGMVGIGAYGYNGNEFVGVLPESIAWFVRLAEKQRQRKYVGCDALVKALKENQRSGIRFNQGDAYFARALGFDTPATTPGEAEDTVMSQMLGGVK